MGDACCAEETFLIPQHVSYRLPKAYFFCKLIYNFHSYNVHYYSSCLPDMSAGTFIP